MSHKPSCEKCQKTNITVEARVVKAGRTMVVDSSALKAESKADEDNISRPFVIQYVHVCASCGYEDVKSERYCE